ncbi:hypothetical protein WJX81_006894 [Elliptochloris bilobata]|uniref:Protein kinase domain-containing protein n=1 Tax=Elliptochloris bilobata TaxID=381761 RepID=A0AAW1R0Y4_9CHLO
MIVMEFCEAGTLWQALQHGLFHEWHTHKPRLRPLLKVALDVAEALEYLHGRRLVHRDITSGNVLLSAKVGSAGSRAGRLHAKVADFGLCMLLPNGSAAATTTQRGTLAYQPPELLAADSVSLATDCYAFGVLLWEMLTAQTPYAGLGEEAIARRKLLATVDLAPPAGMRNFHTNIDGV